MRIPLLPRWVLTNPLPAFYDIESTTSVQMTAKLYKHMQGLTDDYNKFADEINKAIEDYTSEVNDDQECFEAKITKIVHDYIITIDTKIDHQDREIQEAMGYMKTNLSQAIQDTLNTMIENGELNEVIAEAMTEISNKLNTLEPKVVANETNITNLEERVTTIEGKTTSNETNINNLQGRVSTNETNIIDLQGRVSTNETNITNLENKLIYSLEEHLIGTWVDGKPLYRKVIYGSSTETEIRMATPPEVETMAKYEVYVGDNTDSIKKIPTNMYASGGQGSIDCYWIKNGWIQNTLYIVASNTGELTSVIAIIEYTKTTD